MKALSSLAGYDIIFHSATNVMTDSKSLLDQCFYEGSTVSMATHHLWPAVSTQSWQTTAYPTQPYTVRCLETQFYSIFQKRHILKLSRDSEMTFLWQLFLYYRSAKANINCHKQLKYPRLSEIGIVLSQQSTHSAVMVIKLVEGKGIYI